MLVTSPYYILLPILCCMLTVWVINKNSFVLTDNERVSTLDGLRGYLAFFVFLFHACTNYSYITKGTWLTPDTNLYLFLGHGSVQLFFMITGFLFYSKLIKNESSLSYYKKIDWIKFYVARFYRLYPLYLFSITLIFIILFYLSKGVLNETPWELFKHAFSWLIFGLFGLADINETNTHVINSGVIWSLSYEWIFYLLMPTFAFFLKQESRFNWIIFSLITFLILISMHSIYEGKAFLAGIIAAYLIQNEKFIKFAKSKMATFIISISLVGLIQHVTPNHTYAILSYLTIIFLLVVCGNDIFGILLNPLSKALGDLSYSIYLLHGILLYVVFNILVSKENITSPLVYWGIISLITPILIIFSNFTFKHIELSSMRRSEATTNWIKNSKIKNLLGRVIN